MIVVNDSIIYKDMSFLLDKMIYLHIISMIKLLKFEIIMKI